MSLIAQNHANPNAWIVSPKDKGRKSIKNGKVFLKNKSEFEIELFNPLKICILVVVKLNGQSISKNGLVLKPGQRFYLDCFIDDKKKFIFNTYNVDNQEEVLNAIKNNGLLEVFFYKEDIITIDNWNNKISTLINKYHPPYYDFNCPGKFNTPYFDTKPYFDTNNFKTVGINCLDSNFASYSIETGRVEKGESSLQNFKSINMEFESNYITSTIIQLLPESRKPIELINTKKKNNDNQIIELIKQLADLNSKGILTDDEFKLKKSELLSKL